MPDVLRVAFDAAPLLPPQTGIGRVHAEVFGRLALSPDIELRPFMLGLRGRDGLADALPNGVPPPRLPLPARPMRELWARLSFPPIELATGAVDVVHGSNFVTPPSRGPSVVTVHDLGPLLHPEVVAETSRRFPELIRVAIERGAWVQTATEAVAAEVRSHFAVAPDRLVVIPNGVSVPASTVPGKGRELTGFARYVLALGTIEPRKRLADLVRAFDLVADAHPDLGLVIAGPRGWNTVAFDKALTACRHRDRVRMLGFVDDTSSLLADALVLAYPSLYEGFGLPPLEAMAVGVPVVAADIAALQEVLGDAASLVAVGDHEALATAIDSLATNTDIRDAAVLRGRERAAQYSWDRTARDHLALYRRIANV